MTFLEQLKNWFSADQAQLIATLHDRVGALEQRVGVAVAAIPTPAETAVEQAANPPAP